MNHEIQSFKIFDLEFTFIIKIQMYSQLTKIWTKQITGLSLINYFVRSFARGYSRRRAGKDKYFAYLY